MRAVHVDLGGFRLEPRRQSVDLRHELLVLRGDVDVEGDGGAVTEHELLLVDALPYRVQPQAVHLDVRVLRQPELVLQRQHEGVGDLVVLVLSQRRGVDPDAPAVI